MYKMKLALITSALVLGVASLQAEIDDARCKALENRVQELEELLFGSSMSDDTIEEVTRGLTDKISDKIDIFDHVKKMRQEIFKRLGRFRAELKEHKSELKQARQDFDALCALLGSPQILEKLGHDAQTVFGFILKISERIARLEANTQ